MTTLTLTAEIVEVRLVLIPDESPDLSYLTQDYEGCADAETYRAQDAERLAAYEAGEWWSYGIRARATLRFGTPQGGWIYGPTVETPGLWGIESDSETSFFDEIGDQERAELADLLEALGFSALAIADGFATVETRDWH